MGWGEAGPPARLSQGSGQLVTFQTASSASAVSYTRMSSAWKLPVAPLPSPRS